MHNIRFKYLASAAKRLIPKWAKNWQHPEEIPGFQDAFKKFPPEERDKRLEACRRVGWRLHLAFTTDDEYERDWFLCDARGVNAAYSAQWVIAREGTNDKVGIPKGNPLDVLLQFVQMRLLPHMAVCARAACEKKYYFRDRPRQKYCSARCFEIVVREGKLRWYHKSPNSRKNRDLDS